MYQPPVQFFFETGSASTGVRPPFRRYLDLVRAIEVGRRVDACSSGGHRKPGPRVRRFRRGGGCGSGGRGGGSGGGGLGASGREAREGESVSRPVRGWRSSQAHCPAARHASKRGRSERVRREAIAGRRAESRKDERIVAGRVFPQPAPAIHFLRFTNRPYRKACARPRTANSPEVLLGGMFPTWTSGPPGVGSPTRTGGSSRSSWSARCCSICPSRPGGALIDALRGFADAGEPVPDAPPLTVIPLDLIEDESLTEPAPSPAPAPPPAPPSGGD